MDIQQQEIINHALSSGENLKLAISVGQAYDKLREKIITDFSSYMEQELKERGWETNFSDWNKSPLGSFTGFECYKAFWPKSCSIKVEAQDKGFYNYIIGVKFKKTADNQQFRELTFTKCNESIKMGKISDWWPWYIKLVDKYSNFNNPNTLISLYEKQEFAACLLSEVDQIAKVVDSVVTEAS